MTGYPKTRMASVGLGFVDEKIDVRAKYEVLRLAVCHDDIV